MTGPRLAKGAILKGFVQYINKQWGDTGVKSCSGYVGIDLKNIIDDKWYPNVYTDDLLTWISDRYDRNHIKRAGFEAVAGKKLISVPARIAGIERVAEKGVNDFKDSIAFGKVSIKSIDEGAQVMFKDVSMIEETCLAWQGAFEGILALTKTKGEVEKVACEHWGDRHCIWNIKWK